MGYLNVPGGAVVGFLTWLGAAVICIQLAVSPALLAGGLVAATRHRSMGATARWLFVIAGACGVVGVVSLSHVWPGLHDLLKVSYGSVACGVVGAGSVVGVGVLAIRRALRARLDSLPTSDVPEELEALWVEAADAIGASCVPPIVLVDGRISPAVTGVFCPVLLFPAKLVDCDLEHLRIVLLHEMAHLIHWHLGWSRLVGLLAKAIWPNPIGRYAAASHRVLAEVEADGAIGDLEYTFDDIKATRRAVQALLWEARASIGFLPEVGIDGPARLPMAKRLVIVSAVPLLVACSIAGCLAPFAAGQVPSFFGYRGDAADARRPYAFQFATQMAARARAHYDLVYSEASDLIRMRGDGDPHSRRAIMRSEPVIEPCISRDGSDIVYVINGEKKSDIWISDGEGGNRRQLTDGPGTKRHPSISPDGRFVVYSQWGDSGLEKAQLIVRGLYTNESLNLSEFVGPGIEPSFGHDGHYILYMIDGHVWRAPIDGVDSRVLSAAGPGGGKQQLTFESNLGGDTQTDDHGPMASPDGRLIAFTRVKGELEDYWYKGSESKAANRHYTISIWVMNADGTGQREITKPVAGQSEYSVCGFAPTGIWVGYGLADIDNGREMTLWERDIFTGESRSLSDYDDHVGTVSYTGWLR